MGLPLGPRKRLLSAIASLHPADHDSSPAERRHLTILFCDIVASTEYADRLDPEDFRRLVERFLNTCSTIVRRHRGQLRSEEHTSELQSLMRSSYAVFCLKEKNYNIQVRKDETTTNNTKSKHDYCLRHRKQ